MFVFTEQFTEIGGVVHADAFADVAYRLFGGAEQFFCMVNFHAAYVVAEGHAKRALKALGDGGGVFIERFGHCV